MKKDIEIERYESPKVEIYRSNGDFYGILNNEHEFNKFRIQMMLKLSTSEFYFKWNDIKITVDKTGNMSDFPFGLYDQVQRDLLRMYQIGKEQR